jgi:two-component system response regulator MtrA
MSSILIVDDDRAMVGMVAAVLGSEGYDLITAYDGESALRRHEDDRPDLVILDRRLPRMSGDEVCRRIRLEAHTPILMLTGERGTEERAKLLDAGADDYLEKPFGKKELAARVRALLRRGAQTPRPTPLKASVGNLDLDTASHRARVGDRILELTPIEFRLLAALAARPGEVVDRRSLLRAGWPDERDPDPEWLKAHLARLRAKLEDAGAPLPTNVRGVGYTLG